jgi:hypothetical protein
MTLDETVAALASRTPPETAYIPTGSLALDVAMKGYPVGRVTEITGDSASGKTTLALLAVREMQTFGPVLYIPWDSIFSPERGKSMGINVDDLLVLHNLPWQLGPMRFVVIDGVADRSILPRLAQGDRKGPVTVVATSWKYRMNRGQYPWVDLNFKHTGVSTARILTADSASYQSAELYFGDHDLDYGRELLELGLKAGLVKRWGNRYWTVQYSRDVHLGDGVANSSRVLSGKSGAESFQWLRTEIQNILGQHP